MSLHTFEILLHTPQLSIELYDGRLLLKGPEATSKMMVCLDLGTLDPADIIDALKDAL